jgi:uncharacterized protein YlxW (UPF0749 family)
VATTPQEGGAADNRAFEQATTDLLMRMETDEAALRRDIAELQNRIDQKNSALARVNSDRRSVQRTLELLTGRPSGPVMHVARGSA